MRTNIPKSLFIFPNGQIAVTDQHGEQIPALQRSAIELWGEFAESKGYDIDGMEIETQAGTWIMRKDNDKWRGLDK